MRLDREITFQTFSETQNAVGQTVKTWSDYVTVKALKREESGQERVRANRLDVKQAVFWTIDYRDDITESMRAYTGGEEGSEEGIHNIHGLREIGIEQYLEVTTTKA